MLPSVPTRRVTIGDVAAEAGVSIATVSKAVSYTHLTLPTNREV